MSNQDTNECVAGFMLSPTLDTVTLVRKKRPQWQAGKLNGVGGKIKIRESAEQAMIREFEEETGAETLLADWHQFARIGSYNDGGAWSVIFFVSMSGDKYEPKTITDESIITLPVDEIHHRTDVIENLRWLIPLGVESLMTGSPLITQAVYPR